MKKELSRSQIEEKFAEINARVAEDPTPEDLQAIAAAKKENPNDEISLEEFKKSLEEYSGRLVLRIPRSLHKALKETAEIEGVSLNQYMIYKLSNKT